MPQVTIKNFPATQAVTGPLTYADLLKVPVPVTVVNFPTTVQALPYTTSTQTVTTAANVALTSVQLVGTNKNRTGFIIWNNSSNSAYVTFGPTSSSSTPTQIIPTFQSWQVLSGAIWQGPISAIRNAGSGSMTVYELQ